MSVKFLENSNIIENLWGLLIPSIKYSDIVRLSTILNNSVNSIAIDT
jgi:hypothetical protein